MEGGGGMLRHWQKAAVMVDGMVDVVVDAGSCDPHVTIGRYITPRVATYPFPSFSLALDSRL